MANKPGKFILHHGTDKDFVTPKWDAGDKHRDFGQCFYTTYDLDTAKNWAKQFFNGRVYHYCVSFLSVPNGELKIKKFVPDGEWAEFVYNNRYNDNFRRPDYDIIVGPIADNGLVRYFAQMENEGKTFADIAPLINYRLFQRTQLQVCFCSDKALRLLQQVKLQK